MLVIPLAITIYIDSKYGQCSHLNSFTTEVTFDLYKPEEEIYKNHTSSWEFGPGDTFPFHTNWYSTKSFPNCDLRIAVILVVSMTLGLCWHSGVLWQYWVIWTHVSPFQSSQLGLVWRSIVKAVGEDFGVRRLGSDHRFWSVSSIAPAQTDLSFPLSRQCPFILQTGVPAFLDSMTSHPSTIKFVREKHQPYSWIRLKWLFYSFIKWRVIFLWHGYNASSCRSDVTYTGNDGIRWKSARFLAMEWHNILK